MFANIFPVFAKGRILKREMLENLRDFPREFLWIYFRDYSNGILVGTETLVNENTITVTPGIIKFDDKLYLMNQNFDIPYFNTNKEMLIKVKFLAELAEADFISNKATIFIDDNTNVEVDELELGRFKLREGALLRSDYTDFYDFSTEYNTINLIHVEYAGFRQSTINPNILRYFSRIVQDSDAPNTYDSEFVMHCLGQGVVERELIIYYLTKRLGIPLKPYSNAEIYRYLTYIVKELESGIKRHVESAAKKPSRIIID